MTAARAAEHAAHFGERWYFGTTPRFWLNLQVQYDLDIEADRLGDRLDVEVTAHAC